MKILVLGGTGMLGHKVVQHLTRDGADVHWTIRTRRDDPALAPVPVLASERAVENVDLSDLGAARALLRSRRPDVVVNCAGVIKQRAESTQAIPSLTLNSLLPHVVAEELAAWEGRLIQVSTDCVFEGARGHYRESDEPDATDLYGRSKALGEPRQPRVLVLRTSIIGRELRNHASLLDWFLRQRGRQVRGFRHAMWSGVTSPYLAGIIAQLISEQPRLDGLYHVAGEVISKFDLLHLMEKVYRIGVTIVPDDEVRYDRSLDGTAFESATGLRCPPLDRLVAEIAGDPTPYPPLS